VSTNFTIEASPTLSQVRQKHLSKVLALFQPWWTASCSEKEKRGSVASPFFFDAGAGNETRTRDLNLGKVALYQLSYSRNI